MKPPDTCNRYRSTARGLLLPYIPKYVLTSQVWRQSDVIIMAEFKITEFQWNIAQHWKLLKISLKSSKYQNFCFLLIREGKDISNIHSKLQDHTINICFLNGDLNFLKLNPLPAIFDGLPYPWSGYPIFFSSKWPQWMYFRLPRWLGSLCFGFRGGW